MSYSFNWRYFLLSLCLMLLPALIAYPLYLEDRKGLEASILSSYHKRASNELDLMIKARMHINLVLASSLSQSPAVQNFMKSPETSPPPNLRGLSDYLDTHNHDKNLWFQIIDAKGYSRLRSWTNKTGDYMLDVRKDLAAFFKHPIDTIGISVGKYALSIKAMVPVYEGNVRLGSVEVISRLDGIDEKIRQTAGVNTLLLIDKRFINQMKNLRLENLIDGYIQPNHAPSNFDFNLFHEYSVDDLIQSNPPYFIYRDQFMFVFPVKNSLGETNAYWFYSQDLSKFDLSEIDALSERYLLGVVMMVLMMGLLSLMIFYKRQAEFGRRYFYQIFDTSAEVVFVMHNQQLIDANQAFFNLYSDVSNIEEFNQKYNCVADTFIDEKGMIQPLMEGEPWYEFILKKPQETFLIKVAEKDDIKTFQVKVVQMNAGGFNKLISVLMTNVTEEQQVKSELLRLSVHDDLTGVYNRYYFNQQLDCEWQRSHRYEGYFSLVIFDIDYFKAINDNFGHDMGDKILIQLAQSVQLLVRETDSFCRVGGEEFAIIMPETPLAQACSFAERMRKEVEQISFTGLEQQITISIGVAMMIKDEKSDELYKRTDLALYRAKDQGRNCVVMDN